MGGSHGPFNVVNDFLGCSAEAEVSKDESSRTFCNKICTHILEQTLYSLFYSKSGGPYASECTIITQTAGDSKMWWASTSELLI